MNIALISTAIAAAIGFWGGWQLQGHNLVKLQLEQTNERISQQRVARATLERSVAQVSAAQAQAATLAQSLAVDRERSRVAAGGLRDAASSAVRAASESLAACNANATTQSELLAQCADRYSDLAGKADGHVNDIKTLIASWPR